MRRDFQIALLCALSAIPAGVAMIEAPEYFPILKTYPGAFFYGSSTFTIGLLGAAVLIAIRGERDAEREGAKNRMIPLIGMIVCGIGFLGFAAWYFWPTQTQLTSDLDNTIKLECSYEHFRFPDDGKLFEIITSDDTAHTISFQSAWMTRENYALHPDSIGTSRGMINKCVVTNYNNQPVFNLEISLIAQFSDRNKNTGIVSIIDRKNYKFPIQEINAGENNKIDIYIWNNTVFDVILQFSENIELQRLGSAKREPVKLIPATNLVPLFPRGT